MYLLGCIPRDRLSDALFVTLTYPADWPADPTEWKRHLDNLSKALSRRFPLAAFIWRLEFQRRGAPHYHLIVTGLRWLPHQWVAKQWHRIIGTQDPAHLAAGTRVERVKNWKHLLSYAAKYVGKVVADAGATPSVVGRHWGVIRRHRYAIVTLRRSVSPSTFHKLRRVLRGLAKSRGWRWKGKPEGRGAWLYVNGQTAARLLWSAQPLAGPVQLRQLDTV